MINKLNFSLHTDFSISFAMVVVMMVLHFLPRLQAEPTITTSYFDMFQKKTNTIEDFLKNNIEKFR